MITLSTETFDIVGTLTLSRTAKSRLGDRRRRVSRTATLDGGAVVADMGHSHADRTFEVIHEQPTREEADRAAYLVESYGTLMVSTDEGLFLASPEGLQDKGDELRITLLITEKLTT